MDVPDCMTAAPQAKWDALGISKPPDMPEVIYLGLADKLPPEDEWDFGKHPQVQSGVPVIEMLQLHLRAATSWIFRVSQHWFARVAPTSALRHPNV